MKAISLFFIAVFSSVCLSGPVFGQKPITLDECFVRYAFYPEQADNFQFLKSGGRYAEADEKGNIHIRDVRRAEFDSVITPALPPEAKGFDRFVFSADESKILFQVGSKPVYRHSVTARYFVYDLVSGKTIPVSEEGEQQYVSLSPNGNYAAFVRQNDLYIKNLTSLRTTRLTSDGEKDKIINGLPDWLYEEEFSPVDGDMMAAMQWSPDGTKIAWLRFDERYVPELKLTWYESENYPRISTLKYPKVGERNASVRVMMYDVEVEEKIGTLMGLEPDDYIPKIDWTPDNRLTIIRLNRKQDTLQLLLATPARALIDPEDNTRWIPVRPMLIETDPAYVEVESARKLTFIQNTSTFLWLSDGGGFTHLYRYAPSDSGKLQKIDLTPGDFDVTAFYGIDQKTGRFYFQAATPTPLDRQIWQGDLQGWELKLLTPEKGTHEASFSPDFSCFVHKWSDANTPPRISLQTPGGETPRKLADNKKLAQTLASRKFSRVEFFQYPLADGTLLNGWMIKPDSLTPGKKYPVLMEVYGGPGAQTVLNQYDGYLGPWRQMLVQKGYIVASVDNRGTGARGRSFKKCTQGQLGRLETEDQIAGARYLSGLPFVDPTRIGVWGWSFGGYLSTSCLFKGDGVFKAAVAVAPVTNWKWYNSAYTERYMGSLEANEKGYDENSPIHFVDRLKNGRLLICHGMADENVHWQHSAELIKALVAQNKDFETCYYPNRNHGISGNNASRHLFTKITDFILKNL